MQQGRLINIADNKLEERNLTCQTCGDKSLQTELDIFFL